MSIDTNTILFTVLSLTTLFFAGAFIRMKMNEKFTKLQRDHEDSLREVYDSQDRFYRELNSLEKKIECCRMSKQDKCEKSYYNSQN